MNYIEISDRFTEALGLTEPPVAGYYLDAEKKAPRDV